uniref:Uncharacterized protein n=1 Tax=Romanomermis culicivorax TaxID=13658 RepID=A0A915JPX2_ROMCU
MGDPELIMPTNFVNAITTRSKAKEVEKKDQAQVQPDGNQGQVVNKENNQDKGLIFFPESLQGAIVSAHLKSDIGLCNEKNIDCHQNDYDYYLESFQEDYGVDGPWILEA